MYSKIELIYEGDPDLIEIINYLKDNAELGKLVTATINKVSKSYHDPIAIQTMRLAGEIPTLADIHPVHVQLLNVLASRKANRYAITLAEFATSIKERYDNSLIGKMRGAARTKQSAIPLYIIAFKRGNGPSFRKTTIYTLTEEGKALMGCDTKDS